MVRATPGLRFKSESQVMRLIRQCLDTGGLRDRRGAQAHAFRRRYTKADIDLLALL